jgi:hypothetical protein
LCEDYKFCLAIETASGEAHCWGMAEKKPEWEIDCVESWTEAKALAKDGWEMVSVAHGGDWTKYYFKREVKT